MNFSGIGTYPQALKPAGYEQISVSTVVKTLTVPAGAVRASVNVESQDIRARDDGTAPDASTGMLIKANVNFEIIGSAALAAFKAIRASSDAKLNVSYYKEI
jgi:hypothetical protein